MLRIPKLVVLNLTTDCNMRCKYCYASAGEKQTYMSKDVAIKTIKELKEINGNNSIKVLFHGGEPLMCLDVIKDVIDFCEKNYDKKSIEYYIQTNCILLNKEVISYLKEKDVKISISLDGCDPNSNACRILKNKHNSFDIIKKSIDELNAQNVKINNLAVLNKKNYKNVGEIIDFLVSNKIYNFSFNYFIKGGRGNTNSNLALTNEEIFEATKIIIDKLNEYYKQNILLNEKNVYYLVRSLATKKKLYMCANSPCGAGLNIFGITPNGDIFPCDDLSSQNQFKLGNVKEKHLSEILSNPIVTNFAMCTYSRIKGCKTCKLKTYCGAGCCSRKFYENGDIYSIDPICGFYKLAIPYVQELLNSGKIIREIYNI